MIRNRQNIADTGAPTINKATQTQTVQTGLALVPAATQQTQQTNTLQRAQKALQSAQTKQLQTQTQTPSPELSSDVYCDDNDVYFEELQIINFDEACNYGYTPPPSLQQVYIDIKNEIMDDITAFNNNNAKNNNNIQLDLNQHDQPLPPSQLPFDLTDLPF